MNSQTEPGRYSSGPDGASTFDRNPGGRVNNWKSVLNVLLLTYGDRLTVN